MKQHYKKLIHLKKYNAARPWKLFCGYDNYCVKTSRDPKKITCPKCLEVIEKSEINEGDGSL